MTGNASPSIDHVSGSSHLIKLELTHFEVLRDLTDKTLKGKLADEKFSRLLVTTDFAQRHSSGTEAMRLLYTTSDRLSTKAQ